MTKVGGGRVFQATYQGSVKFILKCAGQWSCHLVTYPVSSWVGKVAILIGWREIAPKYRMVGGDGYIVV